MSRVAMHSNSGSVPEVLGVGSDPRGLRTSRPGSFYVESGVAAVTIVILALVFRASPHNFSKYWFFASVAICFAAGLRIRHLRLEFFVLGLMQLLSPLAAIEVNRLVVAVTPQTYDAGLAWIDRGTSARIYHWVAVHQAIHDVLTQAYLAICPYIAAIIYFSERRRQFVNALIWSLIVGPVFYCILPAVGPAHTGDPEAYRNCMPSLHFSWALISLIYASRRAKIAAAAYVVLMAAATIGLGEHYLVDLVAAIPFTAAACSTGWPLRPVYQWWDSLRNARGDRLSPGLNAVRPRSESLDAAGG